jgi:hypothetical protein
VNLGKEEAMPGHLIFDLFFQNKHHTGGETVTEGSATAEAAQLWQEEENGFVIKMQEADDKREEEDDIALPEDIMPSFDKMM